MLTIIKSAIGMNPLFEHPPIISTVVYKKVIHLVTLVSVLGPRPVHTFNKNSLYFTNFTKTPYNNVDLNKRNF